ncbi:hypothetical protein [Microbispora sp. ATCC PTA-5024]|uniref:hypothetical protein n=1 Tax=Microbispora sp. ATCC PTA-5024 TaxID=316330 RepID=UPI0003F964C9|nr:hypothetical protein [Microbispora sp. ATCC PTA-5024]
MGAVAPGTGPLSPGFSGISPEPMSRFVAEMEHARGVIGEHAEAVRRVLAARGLPAASLGPIGEAERWLDERLPDLRRRRELAAGMARLPSWSPGALLPYEEGDLPSPAEARRLGGELAEAYRAVDPDALFDPGLDEKYARIVRALAAYVDDPEFTAAFFAGIGARRSVELPGRLRRGLEEGVEEAVATVSRALGSAVSGGAAVPGFAAVTRALQVTAEGDDDRRGVGDLLSGGRFPTEWLAGVVAAQAFLPHGGPSGATLAPYLDALARHPSAARLAIWSVTRDAPRPPDALGRLLSPVPALAGVDRRPDLVTFLRELNARTVRDDASAAAFGRLLAAASGAYDERDGAHSDVAARFAFTVITGAARFPFAPPARVHLAEIAGSYATEMTEGADLGDDNQLLPSAYGPVRSRIPGLRPAFRLSPEDTFRFLLTFAGDAAARAPFDAGMGELTLRLVKEGVPAMRAAGSPTRLDDLFAALGNVRGFELGAAEKLGRPIDDRAEAARSDWSFGYGSTLGMAGLAVPGGMYGAIAWTALSMGWSLLDTYQDDPPGVVGKLRDLDDRETLGRRHAVAQMLMDAGFPAKVPPPEFQAFLPPGVSVAGSDGRLRPFADILQSGPRSLRALDQWFITNGMGSDKKSLGDLSQDLAAHFDGQKSYGRVHSLQFNDQN